MSIFSDALRKGVERARLSQDNMSVIDDIFAELGKELSFVDRRITLERREPGLLETVHFTTPMYGFEKSVLVLSADGAKKIVGYFAVSELGFPCSVKVGNSVSRCADADALRSALAEMLSTMDVGSFILSLSQETALDVEGLEPLVFPDLPVLDEPLTEDEDAKD